VVRLHLGNTDIAPYGVGSHGARGGTAGKACAVAATLLGLNSGDDLPMGRSGAADDWAANGPTLSRP
jgi:carbon-monoxide dehydrogenase large subunit